MHNLWRKGLTVLAGCLCWLIFLATVARLLAPPFHRLLAARLGDDPIILGLALSWMLAAVALLLPSFLIAIFAAWRLRHLRIDWISRCPSCRCYLAGDNAGVCPECGASTQRRPTPNGRPLIVRRAVCSLCETKVDVPVEAREWARCPNCGALVPI
jgi:predicted RNA-binding Zn-ribbon protein involved in translation (DUF1610 family)